MGLSGVEGDQRVGTDQSRSLGDPAGQRESLDAARENITWWRPGRESDRPIVAKKRVMTVERRGRSGDT